MFIFLKRTELNIKHEKEVPQMSDFKDSKIYSIGDFINWYNAGLLQLSPKYQRNQVWNPKAKSYLIDTILRGLPIPQIFLRQNTDVNTLKTYREVIDGQQRLTAIIEYIEGDFAVMRTHNKEYANRKYQDLPEEVKAEILDYQLSVELIKSKNDAVIYDMFSRVNTNSMTVNKQELRNAKYWGEFKVFVYNEASKWRNFFIDNNIFSDNQLSRMLDVEFVSSLVIQLLEGIITETPSKIDSYYEKYDESFNEIIVIEEKMDKIRLILDSIFSSELYNPKLFNKKNYFYSLFTVVHNELFSVPVFETDKLNLLNSPSDDVLVQSLKSFEYLFESYQEKTLYNQERIDDFENIERLHKTRTTNEIERIQRIKLIYKYLG